MFKKIEDLPADVIGIEITGKLTHKDYVETFIPLVEKELEKRGNVKILCQIGPDFDGMELAAMWDDAKFGIKHWNDISHIALVTEEDWLRAVTAVWAPLFPGVVRMFALTDMDDAKKWIAEVQHQEAA